MTTDDNPWLHIPAQDYEAHMSAIGQSAALRDIFVRVYTDTKPRRVLVLGCTTGSDLELMDPNITRTIVGVDVNRKYLDIAQAKASRFGDTLHLVHGDVLNATLPATEFDLIHAALILEYVDPLLLFRRIEEWLAPSGLCSVVSQNPAAGVASVSKTAYDSLLVLDECMSLFTPDQVNTFASQTGLERASIWNVNLPGEKSFAVSLFRKQRASALQFEP